MERQESIVELVREVVNDVSTLVRQEIALARAELREESQRAIRAAIMGTVAAGALGLALLWLLIALTQGLAAAFGWPLWSVYAGVGLVLALVGGVLLSAARKRFTTIEVLPKTRQTLRAHAHWTFEPGSRQS